MFKGYKLSKVNLGKDFEYYYNIGQRNFNSYKVNVKATLDGFFLNDKSLDANKIINSWFPEINVNVFISHSHNDSKDVIALAGWLYDNFKVFSFIDSCIWGYGNDLIQILDNKYSWMDREQKIYYYNKVLLSTSHVHMMLSTALNTMIDKTECLIFYDTPNSIQSFENQDKTESPWLYSEIAFSEIVRMQFPKRLMVDLFERRNFATGGAVGTLEKGLKLKYDANTKHLKDIDAEHLNKWLKHGPFYNAEDALDKFYEITFPISLNR
ncbi:MAG: hypothetical protein PHE56_02755 [Bacteroidales bacterium]|nr:hypothetical protein [Bacteroidales bacterium]